MTRWRLGPWPAVVALLTAVALAPVAFTPLPAGDGADANDAPWVWTAVPDAWLAGLAALRAGDAANALQLLRQAEAQLDAAPPTLLHVRLAAALAAGDGVDAEATAEKLALRADAAAVRAFVQGLVGFTRCQIAARQAKLPGADPGAYDRAIRAATDAARAFETASLLQIDRHWPAATRNAERVLAVRHELVRQRDQQQRDQQREKDPDQPEPPEQPKQIEQELPQPGADRLTPFELQAVLQRLAAAENEKRGVRSALRDANSAAVEQDW
ncbi:MAG: hypothetical protein IPK26_24990 [Planctomycetes bacterium]|nr:hypothetical protein [Planctomycetota bacterium]